MTKTSWFTGLGLLCCALLPAARGFGAGASDPIGGLKPGEWLEVQNSRLWDARYKWPKGSYYTQNGIGFKAIIGGWSGGAYDTKRDRLLVWGGGHFAYGGNEIYGFDVGKLKWERLSDPSLKTDRDYPNGSDKYADGLPRSCHSYGYIQYVPAVDRFMSFGTTANFPKSRGGSTVWAFDFEKRKWEERGSTIAGGIGAYSAVDPVTGHVFARGNMKGARLGEWDPETGKWTDRTGRVGHRTDYQKTADIDPVGRRFVAVGGKGAAKYDVKKFEIGAESRIKQDQLTTKGPQDVPQAKNPGFQYDPVLDGFVGWKGGSDLYFLDPVSWTWEKRPAAASNRVTPTQPDKNGTFGRFRYVPSRNVYIVVNNVKENVFIGRLSDRATAPIPKRFAATLKSGKDAAVVAWVAGQVALWPKAKAEPVLEGALKTQTGPAAEAVKKALSDLK